MTTDHTAYVAGKFDQLRAAVARGDADAASRIVDQVDADGHPQAAAAMEAGLNRTSLARHLAEPTNVTYPALADAVRVTVDRLIALSRWIDESPANAARNPEALDWIRNAKVSEEAGEVIDAMNLVTGANPRKGTSGTMADVNKELLDVAVTALAAYEHNTGHMGFSVAALFAHVETTHTRAELTDGTG